MRPRHLSLKIILKNERILAHHFNVAIKPRLLSHLFSPCLEERTVWCLLFKLNTSSRWSLQGLPEPAMYLAAKAANLFLCCTRKTIVYSFSEVTVVLHSAQVRSCLEFCIQCRASQYKTDARLLDQVHWRCIKIIKGEEKAQQEHRGARNLSNVYKHGQMLDGQIMKQDVQKGFGVSIPGDIRNSAGKLAPVSPNLNRGRWTGTQLNYLQRFLLTSVIL